MAVFSLILTSCDGKKDSEASPAQTTTVPPDVVTVAKKEPTVPPLHKAVLESLAGSAALVRTSGVYLQGMLLEGASGASARRNYLVVCDVPPDVTSVGIACQTGTKVEKVLGKRISTLPSGLSLFGFSSSAVLNCSQTTDSVPGPTDHVIRLEGVGEVPPEEVAAMAAELETVRTQISENQRNRSETMRQRAERYHNGGNRDARDRELDTAAAREISSLMARQSLLNARLKLQMKSIAAVEVAAGGELENSLLVTSSGTIRAIRYKGKWIDLKDILATGDEIGAVKLELFGSKDIVNLSCTLSPMLPSAGNSYSMVAVTTYELESQGSGSLEERLAAVEPVPFEANSGSLALRRQLGWNGSRTKLWLKVFSDKNRKVPVLDEVILLNYPDNFSARWGKPPSPLITLPEVPPNMPEDLVSGQQTLDAKGRIRDLVAAGDGSVVMVRTDQAPFWAALDLKTGQWMRVPWRATADTLLATQAGKIYLIDRKTKIVEIWGLLSGKCESLQLLPIQGTITAAAAPLSDATQPLMVTTEENGYLLDPIKFEVIPSGLDLAVFFDAVEGKRQGEGPLDPATLGLRASEDGTSYAFSGRRKDVARMPRTSVILSVDRSGVMVAKTFEEKLFGSRGRNTTRGFPDHAGSGISITPYGGNGIFPGSSGEIRFVDGNGREGFAVLKNPPVLPEKSDRSDNLLAADRGAYLDTSAAVILLPDEDKLHLVQLKLPDLERYENRLPEYLLAGDSWKIPLPKGRDHKLTVPDGGKTVLGPDFIEWFSMPADTASQVGLKLEWTGELGSQISKDYQVRLMPATRGPEVVSQDGRKTIPLRLRRILSDGNSRIAGFAGSGNVALLTEGDELSAWNLVTGERIMRAKQGFLRGVMGDADQIYLLNQAGELVSYDMETGNPVSRANLGDEIQSIVAGMSSRAPLLAVEHRGAEGILSQIERDGLKSTIVDLPEEFRRDLFIPKLAANASGAAVWSRSAVILRDGRAVTVNGFPGEVLNGMDNGVPDASGQFVVGSESILNIGSSPAKVVKITDLPGMQDMTRCKLDESGRYIMLAGEDDERRNFDVSLRDVGEAFKELFKIHFAARTSPQMPWVISGTNTLIVFKSINGRARVVVYDFDVPALAKELSK